MRDPLVEFRNYNRPFARRNPELLRYKIARMSDGPFAFFRGTFHLFAHDVLAGFSAPLPLFSGPGVEMDLVGDIHSENYGTFKAEDGLVHYDINDFDETTTGRFDFDVCRLATSHFLAARDRGDPLDLALRATLAGLTAYTILLRRLLGKSRPADLDISERNRSGCACIDGLISDSVKAKRAAFINRLTEMKTGKRRIVRSAKYYNLSSAETDQALRLLADYRGRQTALEQKDNDFFEVEDVCGRVSGIGSMGRLRYVVLLGGKGSAAARNAMLEFKEARPSAYDLHRDRERDEAAPIRRAERVIEVQRLSQSSSNRFLGLAVDGELSFQVRNLGPHDARIEARALPPGALDGVAKVQAEILARVHARAAARAVGPTNPLAELADPEAFCQRVLSFALGYADMVQRDFARFKGARADLDRVEEWMDAAG
jgi:uncharacterized protein (DUF2252 family)